MSDSETWSDDLFDRKQQAEDLISYIRSVYSSGAFSGEERSQVIAVDAEYGFGKTFFLKRLAKDLEGETPVAFVDTWSDDFVGEPLISLAATLERAIEPYLNQAEVSKKWKSVAEATGKIAWLGAKGIGKQLAKLAISESAVEGIGAVVQGLDTEHRDAVSEAFQKGMDDELDSNANSATDRGRAYLGSRIAEYREMRQLIENLRSSLSQLAIAAESKGLRLPLVVVVDELDRCRPSYAIKFLEEVKHLFSVPEI